jgi:hypothetical protein
VIYVQIRQLLNFKPEVQNILESVQKIEIIQIVVLIDVQYAEMLMEKLYLRLHLQLVICVLCEQNQHELQQIQIHIVGLVKMEQVQVVVVLIDMQYVEMQLEIREARLHLQLVICVLCEQSLRELQETQIHMIGYVKMEQVRIVVVLIDMQRVEMLTDDVEAQIRLHPQLVIFV